MLRRISLFFLLLFSLTARADLTYQTWYCPNWPCPTTNQPILSSGTLSTTLNYDWGGGQVLDSGRSDYVVVKLTGSFVMPGTVGQTYSVTFLNQDDDGSRLNIGGITVIEDWSGLHGPANRSGTIALVAGQTYIYERWFSEWGGGAVLRQYWYIPGIHSNYIFMNAGTDFTSYAVAPPQYNSGITSTQQTSKTANTTLRQAQTGNEVDIEQIGDNNNITIRQSAGLSGKNRMSVYANGDSNTINLNQGYNQTGTVDGIDSNNHYQLLNLSGNSNSVTTVQKDSGTGPGQYMETTISGSNNVIDLKQSNAGGKTLFTNVNGSNNNVGATQRDGGQHYLDIKLLGNGHTVNALQQGSANHAATIDLTNTGGSSTVNMTQQGTTAQTYSIQQSCANPAGCSTTIVQGQ